MANGVLIVGVTSAVLLGLFGLSCYLMTTVDPPPLPNRPDPRPPPKKPPTGGAEKAKKAAAEKAKKEAEEKAKKEAEEKARKEAADQGSDPDPGEGGRRRRNQEVNVASKTSGTTPKLKVNTNSNSKGSRSVRLPTKFHESKSVILEVSGDEGSPRIEIFIYPKNSMKLKKTRTVRKDIPADDDVKRKSRESVHVKISPDGTVQFEEDGVVIPANVAENMMSEETKAHDLDTPKPMSTEEQTHNTNTLMPIFIESVDLNTKLPIRKNSVVDYIYTHAAITESIAHDKVSISEENAAVDTYTQSPGLTEIRETLAETNQMDYLTTSATLVENTLHDETLLTIENTAEEEDTKTPISEGSMIDDSDSKTLLSTEMDDVLVSDQSSLDNSTMGPTNGITESDNLDSEVPTSRENGAEDANIAASLSEKHVADDFDTKTPQSQEMAVTDTNQPIFAETTKKDLNGDAISRENSAEDAITVSSISEKHIADDFDTKTPHSEEMAVSDTNEPIFTETTTNALNDDAMSKESGAEDGITVSSISETHIADDFDTKTPQSEEMAETTTKNLNDDAISSVNGAEDVTVALTLEKRAADDSDIKTSPSEAMEVSDTNTPIIAETTPYDLNDAIPKEIDAEDAITSTIKYEADQSGETQQELPSTVEIVESGTDAVTDDSVRQGTDGTETTEALSHPAEGNAQDVSEETDYLGMSDTANKVTVDSIEATAELNQESIVLSNGLFKD